MRSRVLVLVAAFALAACSDQNPGPPVASTLPIGLAAVTDLASLAEVRPPGQRVEQISSYDRTGGNADLGVGPDTAALLAAIGTPPVLLDNSFLYRDGDRFVIFDELGPGVVYRLWMTGLDGIFLGALGGDIAFELDDEAAPRLRLTRTELFSGNDAPFLAPLAGNDAVSSGGFYSVLPIPFEHRLRITTSTVPNWVHLTWARLPSGTAVASFDPSAESSAAAARLAEVGSDPKGIAPDEVSDLRLDLAPGSSIGWEVTGPGTVVALELSAPEGAPDDGAIPLGLRLVATWDGASEPQVDAPLDDVFGAALGPGAKSYAFGRDGARSYLYYSMPFRDGAEIAVRNDGGEPVAGWRLRVSFVRRITAVRPATFHAQSRAAHLEPDGSDYVLLDATGTGHVVGVVLTAGCARAGACTLPQTAGFDGSHLEGDERVSVDGSRYPQIHGTGFEDFFSGGFYFIRGAFTLPTHGNPAQAVTSPRRPGLNLRSAYRLFLGDAIPFRSAIRLAIEHGPTDDVAAEMSSLVFYYAIPEPSLVESDRIDVGTGESESSHALAADGRVDRVLTSSFRGDLSDSMLTATGFEATRTRFRVAVDPANRGVRLRRLADIAAGAQSAAVRVNGTPAGTWYTPDVNPSLRFAEFDFDLPAALTHGHDSLDVELDASESPKPWTAFGYVAFSDLDRAGDR